MKEKDYYTFYQNPNIDYLFGYFGKMAVPSKQEKFKPVDIIGIGEQGNEEILKNFYLKKPNNQSVLDFENYIKGLAGQKFNSDNLIKKPFEIEVILSISITEKRYKDIDVDNMAKSVLDGLKGVAFEDDSQVTSLIVKKHIHPMKMNGILIGVTKLTEKRKGILSDIPLISDTEW